MTSEIGRKAIDMFLYLAEGGKTIEITFSGGEPLSDFLILKDLVSYADENIRAAEMQPYFVLKTNGTILNQEIIEFIQMHHMKVVISIDGASNTHDKHRKTITGDETHSNVVRNILNLLYNKISCVASITVHPDSSALIMDNVRYLHSLGLEQFDIGPAYGTVVWADTDIINLAQSLLDVADYIREMNAKGCGIEIGPLYRESEHVNDQLSDSWGCHAASTNLAFLPNGQITGCSALAMGVLQFPNLVLGDVFDGLNQLAVDNLLEVAQANRAQRQTCHKCDSASNCSGGCLAINYSTSGEALTPPALYCHTISTIPKAWRRAWT
jgi:uncharacterized protein